MHAYRAEKGKVICRSSWSTYCQRVACSNQAVGGLESAHLRTEYEIINLVFHGFGFMKEKKTMAPY